MSGVGVRDESFVTKQFEHGDIESSKIELDKVNSVKGDTTIGRDHNQIETTKAQSQMTYKEKQEAKKVKLIDIYSKSSNAGDRAFAILLDLNMVELTPDPEDPDYDHSNDDELAV